MSSNYLWKLYFENDAEAFRRLLLEGTLLPTYREVGPGKGTCLEKKSSQEDIGGSITVSTSWKSGNITGQSLRRQKDIKLSFNRQSLRDYDSRGRSLLHLAATEYDGIPFLRALLSHPQLDITHPDIESGWTALHRALYNGNITAARLLLDTESERLATGGLAGGEMLVKTKDHSGESPFELFHASIEGYETSMHQRWIENHQSESRIFGTEDKDDSDEDDAFNWKSRELARRKDRLLRSGAGDEVFAFGSNKNLTLGFGDGDDRQFPERVPIQRPQQLSVELSGKESYTELSAMEAFKPLDILDIQLSKLHSAIVTSDPHNNLYICGFGHGGRLGLGEEQLTQFTYKNVSIANNPYTVIKVALGLDHTVVVLRNGEVWTWGMNKHGQLGYMTGKAISGGANTGNTMGKHKKSGQAPSGLEESETIQSTPRRVIDTIKRETIIGCATSRIHTVLHTIDTLYVFGKNEGQLGILESSDLSTPPSVPKKVVAGFFAGHTISTVAASDKSTVVMLETHDVWLFAGYGYTRVVFPVQRFFSNPDAESAIYKAASKRSHEPNYISKITTSGDIICGLTSMGDVYTVNVGEYLKSWSANSKATLPAAQRVWSRKKGPMAAKDVDIGQDGSIILCTASGSVWKRVKRTKASELHSNYSVNSGAASSTPFTTESKSKDYKFSRVPGLTRIVSVRSNKFGAYAAIRKDCNILQTQLQVERSVSLEPSILPPHLHSLHSILNIHFWKKYGIESLDHMNPKKWRNLLESVDVETCDMTIRAINSNFTIPVHQAIMLARCNILPHKLKELGGKEHLEWEKGIFRLTRNAHGLRLDIKEDFNIVMLLIIDIYALSLISGATNHSIRTRVSAIGNLLQITGHEHLQRGTYRASDAKVDLSEALRDPLYTAHGDMIVQLAGGEELRAYSTLLRLKSPFFETLFKGTANGQWIESRLEQMKVMGETAIKVDMTHVPREIFEVVLDYTYSGNDNLLQEIRGIHDVETYLEFLLDVLAVADELMMDDLSKICQKIIGFYVNTRNASHLLKAIAPCSQKAFKKICLQYICFNLETMLENHLLDGLDDWIMDELNETVRNIQCSIHSRCHAQEIRLLDKYPDMLEGSVKERQDLIASYAELIEANQGKDDTIQSSSQKQKAVNSGSAIPTTPRKQKKRSTREGSLVNADLHRSTSGGIFEMDDTELTQGTPKKSMDNSAPYHTYASPPSSVPYGDGAGAGWLGVKNGESPSFGVGIFNTPPLPSSGTIPTASPETPTKAWKATSSGLTKLDMKEIMSQAAVTSKRQSNLSLGLSSAKSGDKMASPVATPTPKLSQKEKRRLQQEQQRQQPVVPNTPDKAKPSPWATPTQGPRIALREVLADPNQTSQASQASAVTATVASPSSVLVGSPVQMRSTQPPPAQSKAPVPSPIPSKVIPSKVERISPHTPSTPTPASNQPHSPIIKSHRSPGPQPAPPTRPSFLNPHAQSKPTPPAISSTQAFPSLPSSSSASSRQAEPMLQLSLADIIEQQEAEQAFLKGRVEKRNLEDIQAEQEFLEWWEKESERVRMEAEGVMGEGTRGGRGGKRGGKGGRGRGGKNAAGEGRGGSGGDGGGRRGGGGDGEGGKGGRGMGRGRGEKRGRGTNKGQSSVTPAQGIVIR